MKEFQNQKILVVGGAGFVGSNLVKALLACQPRQVVVVDNLLSAERSNVPDDPRVHFLQGSINAADIAKVLPDDLDYVFHLATFHGNQNSMYDPLADHENNTLPTLMLLERIKGCKSIKKVVYSSAGCTVAEKTYDAPQATTEEAPVSLFLDSPYQLSKIFGEFYCNYYWKQHGVPAVRARFQNVYGPGEILGAGQWRGTSATIWRNVIPTFVYKSLKKLPLSVDNGGVASRDFIYVEDIARGLMCCAARGHAPGAYNVASGDETTILELAQTINRLTGNPTPIELAPKRTWDRSGKRYGSTDKARDEIGFAAAVRLEEGLQRTIQWTETNMKMIESCIARHQQRAAA
ncbi:MAG: NAD-dependent epimerase/dehydratase family protein [Gemmataceae bacterium]